MAEMLGDKRFAHIGRDPRFRQMKKQHHKVKIDNRFKGMFTDKRFKVKYMVDKRGRPVQTSSTDHLREYYHLSSSDDEGTSGSGDEDEVGLGREATNADEKKREKPKERKKEKRDREKLKVVDRKKKVKGVEIKTKKKSVNVKDNLDDEIGDEDITDEDETQGRRKSGAPKTTVVKDTPKRKKKSMSDSYAKINDEDGESSDVSEEDDEDDETDSSEDDLDSSQSDPDVVGKTPDYARGEGLVDSDDSEDTDSEPDIEHAWAEMDKDAPEAEAISRRLAVCNMDWDRIKAVDLIVLFNSFKPPEGVIYSVVIYPSEFGISRMKEEEMHGPVELVTNTKDHVDDESEYSRERLRQYQLKRLKYYYAVVECDTPATASAIYDTCDGMEYESSAAKLDLRYIPDDMTFDQEVKSIARDVPSNYTPSLFVTTALQQSAVELTWDETNKDRIAVTMRKFNKEELDEMDLRDYLASDGDDDGPDPYGDLLEAPTFGGEDSEGEGKEEGEDAAVRKYQALLQGIRKEETEKEDKGIEMEVSWGLGLKETTEGIVKKANKEDLTPWETYLQKRREKNKAKREQSTKSTSTDVEDTAAFSDDEMPEGAAEDDLFTDQLSEGKGEKKKSKKRKKKLPKLTAEEEAKQKEEKVSLSLLMMDGRNDEREHFSLKEIQEKEKMTKRKRRRKREAEVEAVPDTFQMDLSDSRFEAVFTNPLYNIDPSSHEFKKTKAIENLIDEKVNRKKSSAREGKTGKKRVNVVDDTVQTEPARNDSLMLESLVKSVKVKAKQLQDRKKKKFKVTM